MDLWASPGTRRGAQRRSFVPPWARTRFLGVQGSGVTVTPTGSVPTAAVARRGAVEPLTGAAVLSPLGAPEK